MLRVFLSSHAHMASGLKSSLEIFMASLPNLTVHDAYVEGEAQTLSEHLDTFFSEVSPHDDVLLLSDIYGGSVNTVMCSYLNRRGVRLVTGVNLPFVMEVMAETSLSDERLNEIIQVSRDYLRRVELDGGEEAGATSACAANSEEDFF